MRCFREGGVCLFIGLNPSTADHRTNDPTVRRCIDYTLRWGYGVLVVCNIFALRSTDPKGLYRVEDPVGPENDRHLVQNVAEADLVVCAWGNHGKLHGRGDRVRELIEPHADLYCFGVTGPGYPKHPLYLKKTLKPVRFK